MLQSHFLQRWPQDYILTAALAISIDQSMLWCGSYFDLKVKTTVLTFLMWLFELAIQENI